MTQTCTVGPVEHDQNWKSALETKVKQAFPHLLISDFLERNANAKNNTVTDEEWVNQLTLDALAMIDENNPEWTYVASVIYAEWLVNQAAKNRGYVHTSDYNYGSLHGLITRLTDIGIYDENLVRMYSADEVSQLEQAIKPERDGLFTFIGIKTLADRYLATDHDKNIYELPQERFMVIAMTLMQHESREDRLDLVKQAYWAMSNLYMTVATPTLANAGKSYGQLSSCFIDTLDDSLQSIYDSNTDIANLSKNGGGIGVYFGKIRSSGSMIKGFKNTSSGVIPWMKQLNNTAVSVDQLG